jgi:hypothetical protein
MSTVKELKEHLATLNDEDVIAYDLWGPEDAIWQAKQEGKYLTEEQAKQVIAQVDRKKDASVGITWDTLSWFIADFTLPDIPEDCPEPDIASCGDCKLCQAAAHQDVQLPESICDDGSIAK